MGKIKPINYVYEEIKNYDELVDQLESLKKEAFYMLTTKEPIFKKDLMALRTIINFLKENEEILRS